MLHNIQIFAVLIIAPFSVCLFKDDDDDEQEAALDKLMAQVKMESTKFVCWKSKVCKHDQVKICGFDIENLDYSVFQDECTLHKYNCKQAGSKSYMHIKMETCKTKGKSKVKNGNFWLTSTENPTMTKKKNNVIKPVSRRIRNDSFKEMPMGKVQFVDGKPNVYYL